MVERAERAGTRLERARFFSSIFFCFLPVKIQAFLHLQNFTESIYLFDQVQVQVV